MALRCNIVITTYNRLAMTKQCLASVLANTPELGSDCELTVVDNASSDGTQTYLRDMANAGKITRLITMRRNMGVAVASNIGWSASDSDYYVKLDNDIRINHNRWLSQLLDIPDNNASVGAAGYLLCPWHTTQTITLDDGTRFRSFDGLGGGCVAIPRRAHEKLGFWNEDYGVYGYEDLDYGNRMLRAGMLSGFSVDDCAVTHLGIGDNTDKATEHRKKNQITSAAAGERLYLLNKFLFEEGIRPLKVSRKYLCTPDENGDYRCSVNPDYKRFMQMHKILGKHFRYTLEGDSVAIDINALRTALGNEALSGPEY